MRCLRQVPLKPSLQACGMAALDPSNAHWRTSTRSGTNGNCVEVASNLLDTQHVEVAKNLPGIVAVRHSKDPDGPVIAYTDAEWSAFTGGVRDGEFDE